MDKRSGSQSVDESQMEASANLELIHGELGPCSVAPYGGGQRHTIDMDQFGHRRAEKITMESLLKCPGLGAYCCVFLTFSIVVISIH